MEEEVLVIGHSMLPKGTASREVTGVLSIVARVDRTTHRVVESSITLTTPLSQRWVTEQLNGQCLLDNPSPFVERIERCYWGPAQRAIVQCFRDLQRRYHEGLAGRPVV